MRRSMKSSVFRAMVGLLGCVTVMAQPDPDYTLRVGTNTGETGDIVPIGVFLDFANGLNAAGFSLGVCADPDLVVVDCLGGIPNDCVDNGVIVPGQALDETNGGNGPAFFAPATATSPLVGWTVGSVVNLLGMDSVPAQDNAEVVVTQYRLIGPPGSSAPLSVCETGSPVVLPSIGLVGGGDVVPTFDNGRIDIRGIAFPLLQRGDVNNDGNADISDAVRLSEALLAGGPPLNCDDAGDVNDDGVLEPLGDAFYLLNFLFLDGPPVPNFDICDIDATGDPLGCDSYDFCPSPAQNPDSTTIFGPLVLRASDVVGDPGDSVLVAITMDNPRDVQAVSFGFAQDSEVAGADSIQLGSALTAVNGGLGPDFFALSIAPKGCTLAAAIGIGSVGGVIAAGVDQEIALIDFTIDAAATRGSVASLEFVSTLGMPAVEVVVTVDAFSMTPDTVPGSITVGTSFIRADCNGDGNFNIVDVTSLLIFLSGGTPNCLAGCDANDAAGINLVDATSMLIFLTNPAVPPTPFPRCGTDPTPSGFDCEVSPCS